jgi:hypothetical protein
VIVRTHIEARTIDAVAIYAGVGAVYDYSRRRGAQLPHTVTWADVRNALGNMRIWDNENPDLYALIAGREKSVAGPFERLKK